MLSAAWPEILQSSLHSNPVQRKLHIPLPRCAWPVLQHGPHKLLESMFPDAASDALPLERCMRILPHHGDTGASSLVCWRRWLRCPGTSPTAGGSSLYPACYSPRMCQICDQDHACLI